MLEVPGEFFRCLLQGAVQAEGLLVFRAVPRIRAVPLGRGIEDLSGTLHDVQIYLCYWKADLESSTAAVADCARACIEYKPESSRTAPSNLHWMLRLRLRFKRELLIATLDYPQPSKRNTHR
jgi:hypothetical protein